MFDKKLNLSLMKQLAQGELEELLVAIQKNKKAILEAQTVEEMIEIRKGIKVLSEDAQGISSDILNLKSEVSKDVEIVKEHINQLDKIENEISVRVASSATTNQKQATNVDEVALIVGNINHKIEVSGGTMKRIEKLLSTITVAIKDIDTTGKSMKKQVNTFIETAQNVTNNISGISAIAEQTNLLALNASIEAARAGEAGRGFAVVAEEIRKLSDGTKELLDNMTKFLRELENSSMKTSEEVEATTIGIEKIAGKIEEVDKNIQVSKENTVQIQEEIISMNSVVKELTEHVNVACTINDQEKNKINFFIESISSLQKLKESMENVNAQIENVSGKYDKLLSQVKDIKKYKVMGLNE